MIYEDLASRYLARSEKLAQCTMIILDETASYQEAGQSDAETAFAAALHVNMLWHDIMSLLLLHSITDDKWANRTAVRMIATVIYEGTDDLQHIFGKPFRESCNALGILQEIEGDLKRVKKEMKSLREKHVPALKPIRMAAGAHRDHDIAKFLESFLDESKAAAVLDAAEDLQKCLQSWGDFCTDVMKRIRVAVKK